MNKKIIIGLVVFSLALYLTGVFSGLYANKIFAEQTEKEFESLKKESSQILAGTEKQIASLRDYVSFLESNANSMQLGQLFTETLNEQEICTFSAIAMDSLLEQIHYYWQNLPFRIEEYEKRAYLSSDYLSLKGEYTQVAIRTWLMAKRQYEKCNYDLVYGLYFYSSDCDECVNQGEELDRFGEYNNNIGRDVILFPIDVNSDERMVGFLVRYYNITDVPAVLINEKVFQGRLFKAEELVVS